MQVVVAGNHDLSFDAKASAVGTPYRHIIEHPDLEKVCHPSSYTAWKYIHTALKDCAKLAQTASV